MSMRRRISVGTFLAVTLLAWLPCTDAFAQASRTVTGADGRTVEIRDTSRIVTIGGAVTETVFALGHGKSVVAVDQTSTFPAAVRTKPNIGYMRALSAEGVISVVPTLIVAIEGSGPPDVIEILSRAAIPFVLVPEGHDEASVLRKIELIAKVLGEEARGKAITQAIGEDFRAIAAVRERIEEKRNGVFVLTVGSGAPTVGGTKTSADGIFALSGVDNAMKSVTGFKPAVAESTLAAAPEIVVTMIERNHGLDPDSMFALPAFAGTPAARNKRLISIPSYYLSFGPRTAHAARSLAASVYPELAFPALPPRPWTDRDQAGQK
jgi:iron complex transport system substrate-binding protein